MTDPSYLTKGDTLLDRARLPSSDIPTHLLRQAARRLQVIALLMLGITAVTWVAVNVLEGQFIQEFRNPEDWIPPTTGIVTSVLIYLLARSRRLAPQTIVNVGLAYEVGVSYFVAYSQYWNTFIGLSGNRLTADLVGVSGVALWMAFFTVLVPSRPRNAFVALVLSGAAVPLTMGLFIRTGNAPPMAAMNFVFVFVLPYLITIFMCMVAANIIYGLGRDVRRAQRMGSYELLGMIGRGGMGEVWRARHNLLARPAAIKLIRRDALGSDPLTRDETLTRFEQEAQVTAGLHSPHTVELYDFGISEDGSLYYVMELMEGIDLHSLVERFGPVPPARAVYILRQVCASLAEAHRQGLIHRDIKPSNVFLCEHAFDHDFVKVLDFGLVKRVTRMDAEGDGGAVLTRAEMVAGTPAFLAPEIAAGKGPIDGRADLYSLGCVAFWLLTGRPVFDEPSPVATIIAHANTPPPRPGDCAEMPVPPELDELILSCLAKDPGDRPPGAEVLAARLSVLSLNPPWDEDRAREWWETHRPVETASHRP